MAPSKQLLGINKKEHARVVSILTLMVNDALKGIPKYEIKQKFIKILDKNNHLIEEMQGYVWDDSSDEEG